MEATVEKVSNLERRLNVALPVQEIETEVESRLKRLARTVKMHGFRPGKVPYRLVQAQFAGQVRQEVLGDALQKSFGEAVRQQNLRVAGYPRFEPKQREDGQEAPQDVQFSATFEVYPEVAIGELANVTIERPQVSLGDAEIDKTIGILQKQRVHFHPVERAAQSGDSVVIDYAGSIDGTPFEGGTARDHETVLGEGRLLAVPGPSNRSVYPVAQFRDDGRPAEGLKEVREALGTRNPWMLLNFLVNAEPRLNNRKPIDLLRSGRLDAVLEVARRVGAQGA